MRYESTSQFGRHTSFTAYIYRYDFPPPGVSPTKYPTNELLRRKKAGEMLEDDEDMNRLPRGKKTWHGESNVRRWFVLV